LANRTTDPGSESEWLTRKRRSQDQAVVARGSLAAQRAEQVVPVSISVPLDPFDEIRAIFRHFSHYGEPGAPAFGTWLTLIVE
jgi:hypothetical protein